MIVWCLVLCREKPRPARLSLRDNVTLFRRPTSWSLLPAGHLAVGQRNPWYGLIWWVADCADPELSGMRPGDDVGVETVRDFFSIQIKKSGAFVRSARVPGFVQCHQHRENSRSECGIFIQGMVVGVGVVYPKILS